MNHGMLFSVHQFPYLSRPLGVHRIAHYLREQNWDIEVVDWANWWSIEQLKELFRSRYSDRTVFVGFSKLFQMWPPVMEEFAGWIKTNYPHVALISGSGQNPQFQSKYIDYYIQGYGELAIVALLRWIKGNGPRPTFDLNIPGGIKLINAIHAYPAFPMSDLMVRYEDRDYIQPDDWLTVEFSRGCMFACDFCNMPVLGVKTDHTRDADNFRLQLMDAYDRFGTINYLVADETFNDSTEKVIKYADQVEQLPFTPWFSGYIRADLLTVKPAEREHLLRMNFLGQYYGIESLNYESAKSIGKGMKSDRIKQGLIDIKKYFETHGRGLYRGTCSFIVGLPYETEESIENTFSWLQQHWQGQCFNIHKLAIPAIDNLNHPSKMTGNLDKYGYELMTPAEIADYQSKMPSPGPKVPGKFNWEYPSKCTSAEVYWKNPHMNWFTAHEILRSIFDRKSQFDFRPSCYGLSYQLTEAKTVEQKLDLGFAEFDGQQDWKNINHYINKKLSCG